MYLRKRWCVDAICGTLPATLPRTLVSRFWCHVFPLTCLQSMHVAAETLKLDGERWFVDDVLGSVSTVTSVFCNDSWRLFSGCDDPDTRTVRLHVGHMRMMLLTTRCFPPL